MEESMANTEQTKGKERTELSTPNASGELTPTNLMGGFDKVFDDLMRGFFMSPFERRLFDLPGFATREDDKTLTPRADFAEGEKAYELTAELPGIDEKDIEVNLTNDILTIRGKRESRREEKDEKRRRYLSELSYGTFERAFRVPEDVDEGKIEAKFDKGVLTVTLPKSAAAVARQRKIPIGKR
jgi:HSP20 family protein